MIINTNPGAAMAARISRRIFKRIYKNRSRDCPQVPKLLHPLMMLPARGLP